MDDTAHGALCLCFIADEIYSIPAPDANPAIPAPPDSIFTTNSEDVSKNRAKKSETTSEDSLEENKETYVRERCGCYRQ
jgi:hypothetical protein